MRRQYRLSTLIAVFIATLPNAHVATILRLDLLDCINRALAPPSIAPTLPVPDHLPDAKWSKYPPMRRNPADSLGFQPGVSHLSDAVPLRVTHSA